MPGSHGSLTKAGKVREATPKVQARERHTPIPRLRNKNNYVKRFIRGRTVGVTAQSYPPRRRGLA